MLQFLTSLITIFPQDHVLDLYKNDHYLKNRVSIYQYIKSDDYLWDWAWNLCPLNKAKNVLDVGSGLGTYWQTNAKKLSPGCNLSITDLASEMVKASERNNPDLQNYGNVSYETADVENLPYDDASFDHVLCHFVLFYTQNPEKALSELKRVTKPGGIISIITLNSNYCKPLYERAHQLDQRFPEKDIATEQFDEAKADKMLEKFFINIDKHVYEREVQFTKGANLKPFLKSVAQGYQIPINENIEIAYQKIIDDSIAKQGSLSCFSRSALYLCYC